MPQCAFARADVRLVAGEVFRSEADPFGSDDSAIIVRVTLNQATVSYLRDALSAANTLLPGQR